MKKIFLTFAAAAMVLTACNKENSNPVDDGTRNLTLKIANVETRTIQAPGTAIAATLTSGTIFLIASNGNVIGTPIALTAAAIGGGDQVITNVPSTARVYIVANAPSDAQTALEAANSFSDIQDVTTNIFPYKDVPYTDVALINQSGTPAGITVTSSTEAEVAIALTPVISRLELFGVTGDTYIEMDGGVPTGNQTRITAFEVTAILIDSHYPEFNYAGEGVGTLFEQGPQTSFSGIGDTPPAPGAWAASGDPLVATPGVGQVWGYNLPAGSLPRPLIAITGIEYEVSTNGGANWTPGLAFNADDIYYVTVGGYTGVTSFARGNIYQIPADALVFTINNVHTTPNPTEIDLTVTVDVQPWVLVPLVPVIE